MQKPSSSETTSRFGQIVIGPPGSGKTTYCYIMKEYYTQFNRKTVLVNLDPANDSSNLFDIDIRNLISLNEIESRLDLGPNSSFLYSFNFLEKNFTWLKDKLLLYKDINPYIIFDSPGQIEIFTQSTSFKSICKRLTEEKGLNIRLCCVNLIESHNIFDMSKYIFSVMSVLNAMINLELPQINLLSKADLINQLKGDSDLPFDLSFYKNPNNSDQLRLYLDGMNINPKFKALNKKISEFISDFSLVSFSLFDFKNPKHLNRTAMLIDKSNGYMYSNIDNGDFNQDGRMLIAQNDFDNEEEDDEEYNPK